MSSDDSSRWVDIVFTTEPDADRPADYLRISPLACQVGELPRTGNIIHSEVELRSVWFSWKTTCQIYLDTFERLELFLNDCRYRKPADYDFMDQAGKICFGLRWLTEHRHASLSGAFPGTDYFTNWVDENPALLRQTMRVQSTFEFWVSQEALEEVEVELKMFLQQYRDYELAQLSEWERE